MAARLVHAVRRANVTRRAGEHGIAVQQDAADEGEKCRCPRSTPELKIQKMPWDCLEGPRRAALMTPGPEALLCDASRRRDAALFDIEAEKEGRAQQWATGTEEGT